MLDGNKESEEEDEAQTVTGRQASRGKQSSPQHDQTAGQTIIWARDQTPGH